MTDGALARNHRTHPECGNQFRLLFWRIRHVSRPSQQGNGKDLNLHPRTKQTFAAVF